jgi:hypothetical protein
VPPPAGRPYKGRQVVGPSGHVPPVRFELTLPGPSCRCLLPLGYEGIGAATRCRPGSPAVRERGRSRARRPSWRPRTRTWTFLIQSQACCRITPVSISCGRRDSNSHPHGVWTRGLYLYWATPACAARGSNSVPRGKSPVHHPSCLRRLVGMARLERATSSSRRTRATYCATFRKERHAGLEPA